MKTTYQHDLARRLICAALKADTDTPLLGAMEPRTGWICWRAHPHSEPRHDAGQPAPDMARMSDEGRVRFLRLLTKSVGVGTFVRLCDDLSREFGRESLSSFLDRTAPGWRDRGVA